MDKIALSTQLINGILQYLGTRPYTEVANLIAALQQEAQAQIANTATTAPAEQTPTA
jgi:hypothetical protein